MALQMVNTIIDAENNAQKIIESAESDSGRIIMEANADSEYIINDKKSKAMTEAQVLMSENKKQTDEIFEKERKTSDIAVKEIKSRAEDKLTEAEKAVIGLIIPKI